MKEIEDEFKEAKKSNNINFINDFLIKIAQNPKIEYISYIKYFIKHIDPSLFSNVKLNIIFAIGSIGEQFTIPSDIITYLIEEYYKSDMWVRNEIIDALKKISKNSQFPKTIIGLLKRSLHEDYALIKSNSLYILNSLKEIPKDIQRELLRIPNQSMSQETTKNYSLLVKRIIPDEEKLFKMLEEDNTYELLSKNSIKTILISYFDSILHLESFQNRIIDSRWSKTSKELFIKEINVFKKILLRNF
ncbi:MAG: HEAT repeat domain-containing protein [Promethearchaeota archaeon]